MPERPESSPGSASAAGSAGVAPALPTEGEAGAGGGAGETRGTAAARGEPADVAGPCPSPPSVAPPVRSDRPPGSASVAGDEPASGAGPDAPRGAPAGPRLGADELVALVAEIAVELRVAGNVPPRVGLDTDLGRDLGLDSLTRMELLARVERAAGASLPDRVLAEAATPREILHAFASVGPSETAAGPNPDASPGGEPLAGAPAIVAGPHEALRATDGPDPGAAPGSDEIPAHVATLIDALIWHAGAHPERVHVRFIDGAGAESTLTYGGLLEGASRIAAGLVQRRLTPGRAVAIMLPSGFDYLQCFLGVQLAGGVPLPIYPPARLAQLEDHLRRHERILANGEAEWLVTFDEARRVSRLLAARAAGRCRVVTVRELAESGTPDSGLEATPGPDDIAFLQYTSGSTGQPKGVVLTHRNVLASLEAMAEALGATSRDVFVSWLPLYHDLGLIAAWLGSLVYGFPLVLMSPLTFLARPVRWLQAIHHHRGTLSGGPNFAFDLCTRRIADDEMDGLDLSSWRMSFNGAEPVHADTLRTFAERFAPFGFDPGALAPVYGLAEATLGVAFTPVGRGPRMERIERDALERERRARPARAEDEKALTCISSGVAIPGFEVRTVDDSGRETPERVVGRLQFRGPSTTSGYFRDRDATAALFDGDWLESGDLAYVAGGELYITGRVKDVVIRAGRNLYPYDFEQVAGDTPGVRRGCVALFAAQSRDGTAAGTERLVAVVETRETDPSVRSEIRAAIGRGAEESLGQPVDELVLAPPHTVLKTSSGKIRRRAMAELYEAGELSSPGPSRAFWLRVARLAAGGAEPVVRRAAGRYRDLAFAGWVWTALALAGTVPALAAMVAGRPQFGFAGMRAVARAVFRLAGIRLTVEGVEHLDRAGPFVVASNHASYLDGLVLIAAFPRAVRFVAKAELRENLLVRWFLDGIGVLYVDRFQVERSVAHASALAGALAAGDRIAIFPEGTLHRMPGLLRFQMGAFKSAVEAGAPVVPVVLRGTRSLMRDGTWFPRRVQLHVRFGEPVDPPERDTTADGGPDAGEESDWARAVRLRDTVRGWMLAHCGEPDLADRNPLRDLVERRTGSGN